MRSRTSLTWSLAVGLILAGSAAIVTSGPLPDGANPGVGLRSNKGDSPHFGEQLPKWGLSPSSPIEVAFSPDGRLLAVSDHTAGQVVFLDPAGRKVVGEVALHGRPSGLAWATTRPDATLFVAETGAGTVAEVDPSAGRVVRRIAVGPRPVGLAIAEKRKLLLATNGGLGSVSVVDLESGRERARVVAGPEPVAVAVTPDEALAVVANLRSAGDATQTSFAAAVSLIDLATLKPAGEVKLPPGSTLVRDVAVSPDGKWAYAVHTLGRFTLPTTQLERGWVNTNALTVIDLAGRTPYATVLLDHVSEGAADPWGVALAGDGRTAWVTLAGVHQAARIDLARLHSLLAGQIDKSLEPVLAELNRYRNAGVQVTWLDIKADPKNRALLVNDLTALHVAGAMVRTKLPCSGPRGIALSPDGKRLAVAAYFSGQVLLGSPIAEHRDWGPLADPETGESVAAIPLGPAREGRASSRPDPARRGEMLFHDATLSFQHWLSCSTCHPDGRADGLNWDLLNDGIGNPKNTRSLLWSHRTPPVMSRGIRPSMESASAAGFRFILFREPHAEQLEAVRAYLRSLQPATSPHRVGGKLSEQAERGRKLFDQAGCAHCHPAGLFTDLKSYDVGTRHRLDQAGEFDTPTLIELWRTGPYLHDGSAATIKDVLTTHNRQDRHGQTSELSAEQIDDLTVYLLSL